MTQKMLRNLHTIRATQSISSNDVRDVRYQLLDWWSRYFLCNCPRRWIVSALLLMPLSLVFEFASDAKLQKEKKEEKKASAFFNT